MFEGWTTRVTILGSKAFRALGFAVSPRTQHAETLGRLPWYSLPELDSPKVVANCEPPPGQLELAKSPDLHSFTNPRHRPTSSMIYRFQRCLGLVLPRPGKNVCICPGATWVPSPAYWRRARATPIAPSRSCADPELSSIHASPRRSTIIRARDHSIEGNTCRQAQNRYSPQLSKMIGAL